ncbi:MAG: Chaperone protein dnaK2 [bacterium ADurb.Bin425]|nr:MAG: Chaperone protein dnaK2 [bacterium ADurb.Bin425]
MAVGAAVQAGVLAGEVSEIVLLDVTPLSLGIETMGGVFTKLVEKNTTIPTHKSQIFSTAEDNQPNVDVMVFQGERPIARDNKLLGTFLLDGIPPAPRGLPKIEVSFDIDANGILSVTAREQNTGKEQKITITASTNLTKEDIERMIRDAEANGQEDQKKKAKADLRNEADALIYSVERHLQEFGSITSSAAKARAELLISELRQKIKDDLAYETLKQALDDLAAHLRSMQSEAQAASASASSASASADREPVGAAAGGASSNNNDVVDAEIV